MKTKVPAAPRTAHDTVAERAARGKAVRGEVARADHSALEISSERDPVALLEQESASRVPELVPVRYGRMLVSAFTFYRGAAGIMAADLARSPHTGLTAQLCGDAHLSNFGGFASPERALVFDLNDFDETLPGPFEWDVKRLATSFEIAGRDRGASETERRKPVLAAVRAYREAMREFAGAGNLEVWYARQDAATIERELRAQKRTQDAKALARGAAKARTKDSMKAFAKLTHVVDGELRIVSDPPLIVPIDELGGPQVTRRAIQAEHRRMFDQYRETLPSDRQRLLAGYRIADVARKVVGVGSVGTQAWIVLLLGRDAGDPLFLQVKEAEESVLEAHLGASEFAHHGRRVVEGQRLMQAVSDIFLGWIRVEAGIDGRPHDLYLRQLWDWKSSIDTDLISPDGLEVYARICGWTLARAHARSGDRVAIASYLGRNDVFDRAVADFATAYADLNTRDYETMVEAVRAGRIETEEGR